MTNRTHHVIARRPKADAAIQLAPVIPAKAGIQYRPRTVIPRLDRGIQYLQLSVLALVILFSITAFATPITIQKDKIIQQTITLTPGFATMIQFPQDIMSMDLADPKIIHCERSSVDPKSALCKPKTYDAHSTNLIVTTESNRFNLTLSVTSDQKKKASIITFKFRQEEEPILNEQKFTCLSKNDDDFLLNDIVAGFRVANFHRTIKNEFAKLKTEQIMFIGRNVYLTFIIENNDYAIYEILRTDIYLEKLGGMTGLAIRSERTLPASYRLTNHSISKGETAFGVIRFKKVILEEDQILSFRISEKTDKRKDLYFKFNL